MKLCFFLQMVEDVPVGIFSFRFIPMGRFHSDVLSDLQAAEGLSVLRSQVVVYPGGYGYQIDKGPEAEHFKRGEMAYITQYEDEIQWVSNTFGASSAGELELLKYHCLYIV